jgi:DNA-binding PadR family transcriptional regulator
MAVGEWRGGASVDGGLESMPAGRALRLLVRGLLRVPRRQQPAGGSAVLAGVAAQHLMLALLSAAPGHPYELYRRYQQRFGELVPMAGATAYKMLPMLVRRGEAEGIPVAGRPGGRRFPAAEFSYRITEAGEQAARRWILSPVRAERWRQELLARMDAASILGVDALYELISRYEHARGDEERELRRQLEGVPESEGVLGHRLSLQERLGVLERQGQWVLLARGRLQQRRP